MREIVFEVARERVDAWSDALLDAGAQAVQAEDADADSPDEQAIYGEPGHEPAVPGWQRTRLAALIDDAADPAALLRQAANAIGQPPPSDHDLREVPDQDWVHATQAQFEPIPVGRRLLIAPSWHLPAGPVQAEPGVGALPGAPAPSRPARIVVQMDPGLAFGTGSHPTTWLCLQWLDEHLAPGARVIDYGCGSGILAIAAARLGAREVVALDIDPQALAATRDNAQRNGVALQVRAAGDTPPPEPADVVVANILSNPLKLLAPALAALVAPGGALVLSGVLARQADEVRERYAALLPVAVAAERDGWVCLAGWRPDGAP